MALPVLFLLFLTILLGGPIAVGALSRGYFKVGLSLAAAVAISTMLIVPPAWLAPMVRAIGSFLK